MPKPKATKWFVGFFVKGIPPSYRVHSPNKLRMARIGEPALVGLKQLREMHPAFDDFLSNVRETDLVVVVVRVLAFSESDAAGTAWRLLGHVRDGLAFVLESPARVAPVIITCPDGHPDAKVHRFVPTSWISLNPKDAETAQAWDDRCRQLLTSMLKFYDSSLANRWCKHSALTMQIINSARLYRLGSECESYGLEFLCKFAAMEGLVAGSARRNKRSKLLDRIPSLGFAVRWNVKGTVANLWRMRNRTVHEARIEYFPKWNRSYPLQLLIPRLEFLAVGVFVFACKNAKRAKTVSALWNLGGTRKLPAWTSRERPKVMRRLAGESILMSRSEIWKTAGRWFDAAFQHDMSRTLIKK